MTHAGVSTACLYPMETDQALEELLRRGVKRVELFINARREIEIPYLIRLKMLLDTYDAKVVSMHPYTCQMEPMWFFMEYSARLEEGLAEYQRYFQAMQILGAKIFVLHGNHPFHTSTIEEDAAALHRLSELAAPYGVVVAQENVARNRSRDLEYLKGLKTALGAQSAFVLDTKQALRCNLNPLDLIEVLGKQIVHVHYSESGPQGDCLAFGMGADPDYPKQLVQALNRVGFQGDILLELYRGAYGTEEDSLLSPPDFLAENYFKLEQMIASVK